MVNEYRWWWPEGAARQGGCMFVDPTGFFCSVDVKPGDIYCYYHKLVVAAIEDKET